MLVFGHLGITVGIFKTCDILANGGDSQSGPDCKVSPVSLKSRCFYVVRLTEGILATLDYRLLLLGSMLPDILDKPTWLFAFSNVFPTGRGYGHSLLLNLVLLIGALVLFRYRKPWLLTVSLSSFAHLLLDQIWNEPVVLLWPLLGPLPESERAGWYSYIMEALFSDPSVYIPEMVGFAILLLLFFRMAARKELVSFIKTGIIKQ